MLVNGGFLTRTRFDQFRANLLELVRRMSIFHFEQQVAIIIDFVLAPGAARKAARLQYLIRWMFEIGGGPMKVLMQWINDHTAKPWEATKMVVRLAAQLKMT